MTDEIYRKLKILFTVASGLSDEELDVLVNAALNLRDGWLTEEPTQEIKPAPMMRSAGQA